MRTQPPELVIVGHPLGDQTELLHHTLYIFSDQLPCIKFRRTAHQFVTGAEGEGEPRPRIHIVFKYRYGISVDRVAVHGIASRAFLEPEPFIRCLYPPYHNKSLLILAVTGSLRQNQDRYRAASSCIPVLLLLLPAGCTR